jgi:hypothetical protein
MRSYFLSWRRNCDRVFVTASKIRSCFCSTGFSFMQKCRMVQNQCVLPSEVILHILSQSGHVAKPRRFLEPSRGSVASPKDARRISKASVPLENALNACPHGGRRRPPAPHPPSGTLVKVNASRLEGHFACDNTWFSEDELFGNPEARKAEAFD